MAINLFGDPTNIQGGTTTIQGSSPTLQPAYNPQQPAPYGPTPAPVQAPAAPKAPVAPTYQPAPIQVAQPDTQINSIFSPFIGSRPSVSSPGTLEYYNKQTGQGFSDPQDLYSFASSLGAGVIGSFDQLHAPVNSGTVGPQIQNVQSANLNPNQQIAQNSGTAGLTPDEYLKLIQTNTNLTPDQIAQIQQGLGIPDLANQTFQPPQQNTVDFYNQLYGSTGLADVKQRILDLNNQIAQRQQNFLDAQGTINENPFLSEASRVGRVSRLNDKAQAEINNLLTQQQEYQTLYQNGLGEINNVVAAHTQDFTTQQNLNSQKLTYLLAQAEQQKTALQAQNQQAAYQYLPDYLKARAKATAPTTITAPSGATFYYDKTSGTFQQLSPAGGNYDVNPLTGDLFSKNTGQGLGTNYGAGLTFSTNAPANGFRTDRNNNPTAFTTDVAKTMGLVEGVDYVQGDKFPGSSNLYTAKLLGDPIATTIKGIDKAGFYTASGQPRWSYLSSIPDAKNWANLSYDQKARVVAQMYQQEGGSGSLVQGSSSGNLIQTLAQQLLNGSTAPSQVKDRKEYGAAVALANQMSLQQTGKPFDTQAADINYQNAQDIRPILNNESSANAHLDTVLQDAKSLGLTSNRLANIAILDAKLALGDSAAKNYVQAINDAQSEIAKVLAGTGAVTDQVRSQAEGFLDKYVGLGTLQGLIDQARTLMHQKVVAYTAQRDTSGGLQMPGGFSASDPLGLGI